MTPQLPIDDVRSILEANGVDQRRVAVVAIRGYYLDSMGARGRNDRRIYDDAQFVVWPDGVARYQANTDPNGYRKGRGTGRDKGMAMLATGIHIYGTGLHRKRLAFRQCEKFTVIRDGDPPYRDTGWHGINWHSGGLTSTSSLGCQTNKPADFQALRSLLYGLLDQWGNPKRRNDRGERVRSFPYLLIDETERREGNLVVSQRYRRGHSEFPG